MQNFLFFISIVFTLFSSAFFTLIFENKKLITAGCIFGGILFAKIVFTYEFLSLFSAIKPIFVVIINSLFFVLSFLLIKKTNKKPDFKEDFETEKRKLKFVLKKDKWLKYSLISFFIFLIGSLIFMYFMPSNDEDAFSYHVARLPFWYEALNLNHFECSDIRALIMPINSEIFYFWAYSFIKSDIFVRVFSFLSYLLFVLGLNGFLDELKIPVRISLWIILTVTALQSVMFSITGTETNISIAALVISSVYLFLLGVKECSKKLIFFSSLLYALAIGVKTPALQTLPAFLVILAVIVFVYEKKSCFKYLSNFILFLTVNFVIFSSYNYVLNFIDFGNPVTSVFAAETHRFYGGIKIFISNFAKYFAMLFDFSGFPFSVEFWRLKVAVLNLILALFNIQADEWSITPDSEYFELGNNFENMCGLGILGCLVFLPSLYIALKRIKHSQKSLILGFFAIGYFINLVILSLSLGYMIFSVRFIMYFTMIAAPVIYYFFLNRKFVKIKTVVAVIIIYTFTLSYYFYERRFTPYLMYIFYKNPSVEKFKNKILSANIDYDTNSQSYSIMKEIENPNEGTNVLYFASSGTNIYYPKHIQNDKMQVDFRLLETTDENDIDWNKYDYIVIPNVQKNTNIKDIYKYKNAITSYNDGSNGKPMYYDFSEKLFANCIFLSSRQKDFRWLSENENRITTSKCFYKPYMLEKHGFYLIKKVNSYDKNYDEQLNLYKKKK